MLTKLSICLTLVICVVVQQIPPSSSQNMCNCPSTGDCQLTAWSAACETIQDCINYPTPANPQCINKICCVPKDQSHAPVEPPRCPQGMQYVGSCMLDVKDPAQCKMYSQAATDCKVSPTLPGVGACCVPKPDYYYYYYH